MSCWAQPAAFLGNMGRITAAAAAGGVAALRRRCCCSFFAAKPATTFQAFSCHCAAAADCLAVFPTLLCRIRTICLVNKRLRELCLSLPLLGSLVVDIGGARALPRTVALRQFLAAHAAHIRELDLHIGSPHGLPAAQQMVLSAAVAGCMVACAAAGALQQLNVSAATHPYSTSWLPQLTALRKLRLGNPQRPLQLPEGVSRLMALQDAELAGAPVELEGGLPPSLTSLFLQDPVSTEMPRQVGCCRRGLCAAADSVVAIAM